MSLNLPAGLRHQLVFRPYELFFGPLIAGAGLIGGVQAVFRVLGVLGVVVAIGLLTLALLCLHLIAFNEMQREEFLQCERDLTVRIEGVRGDIDKERRRLSAYKATLHSLSHRYTVPHRENFRLRYWIGDTDADDRVEQFHESWAELDRTLLWRHVDISASGEGTNVLTSFEQAEVELASEDGLHLDLLPIQENSAHLKGLVVFSPAVSQHPRRWSFRYRWPGLWHALRTDGADVSDLWVPHDNFERVDIYFVFPRRAFQPVLTSKPQAGGPVIAVKVDGRQALRWTIQRPPIGHYSFGLAVRGLA